MINRSSLILNSSYGADIFFDATGYAYNIEFTTNEYGFWYLSCNLRINKQTASDLYKQRKVLHVYYGDGRNTFFEGRLEDVEYSQEPKITAYGYIRSFTDLQITDLWSTKRYDLWTQGLRYSISANNQPDMFTAKNDADGLFIALNKNTQPSNTAGVSTPYTYYFISVPDKYTRPLTTAHIIGDTRNRAGASWYCGMHGISVYPPTLVQSNLWLYPFGTGSGVHHDLYVPLQNMQAIMLFMVYANNVLYAGETGDLHTRFYNLRIGTTPSISGGQLYADEILKYTLSGVFALNPEYISADTSYIQSPQRDIEECIFEDINGLDVIQFLLDYPDSNGDPYELKIWEEQKVIFRPAKQVYNTWRISVSDFTLVRTLEGTYNQFRGIYTEKLKFRGRLLGWETYYWTQQVGNITRVIQGNHPIYEQVEMDEKERTDFYSNQESIDTYGIKRQTNVALNTTTDSASNAKIQTIAEIQSAKQLKSQIAVPYVLDNNGAKQDPRKVRSGDKIIITNIPAALIDEIENTFFITETRWNDEEKLMYITPAQPIDQLATILG
jgi:hypothetical protein